MQSKNDHVTSWKWLYIVGCCSEPTNISMCIQECWVMTFVSLIFPALNVPPPSSRGGGDWFPGELHWELISAFDYKLPENSGQVNDEASCTEVPCESKYLCRLPYAPAVFRQLSGKCCSLCLLQKWHPLLRVPSSIYPKERVYRHRQGFRVAECLKLNWNKWVKY